MKTVLNSKTYYQDKYESGRIVFNKTIMEILVAVGAINKEEKNR